MCKSGKHAWTRESDAAKCCNGFKRVLCLLKDATVISRDPEGPFGFGWVKTEQK